VRLSPPSPSGRCLANTRKMGEKTAESPGLRLCAVARITAPARDTMWRMTWRAPAHYAVDDAASTGALCGG